MPTKRETLLGMLTVAASATTAAGTLWGFTERVFAGEIAEQLKPVIMTQRILLESDISSRRRAITALEWKRDNCTPKPDCWSVRDAEELVTAKAELDAREQAYRALTRADP